MPAASRPFGAADHEVRVHGWLAVLHGDFTCKREHLDPSSTGIARYSLRSQSKYPRTTSLRAPIAVNCAAVMSSPRGKRVDPRGHQLRPRIAFGARQLARGHLVSLPHPLANC